MDAFRSGRPSALHRGGRDPQHHQRCGKVHLALASASERIKGLEAALGVSLLTRGRRGVELTPAGESLLDHARVVMHNVEAMRGDLLAYASGAKATVRFLANTSGLSEYLPKALAAFPEPAPSHLDRRRGTRKLRYRPRHPERLRRSRARRRTRAAGQYEADLRSSEDRLVLVAARGDELANRRQVDFSEVVERDFVGLLSSIALHSHVSGHAARLGARLRFRAADAAPGRCDRERRWLAVSPLV